MARNEHHDFRAVHISSTSKVQAEGDNSWEGAEE